MAEMLSWDVNFTFYLVSGWSYQDQQWKDAFAAGSEIGNHTSDHNASDSSVRSGNQALSGAYGKIYTMAAPNGYTDNCNTAARELHILDRGVNGGMIKPNDSTDMYNLPTNLPQQGASTDALVAPADRARSQGGWETYRGR